jgi:hypothetical protein
MLGAVPVAVQCVVLFSRQTLALTTAASPRRPHRDCIHCSIMGLQLMPRTNLVDTAGTVDTVGTVGTVDLADTAGTVDLADTAGTVDLADTAGTVDLADTAGTVDALTRRTPRTRCTVGSGGSGGRVDPRPVPTSVAKRAPRSRATAGFPGVLAQITDPAGQSNIAGPWGRASSRHSNRDEGGVIEMAPHCGDSRVAAGYGRASGVESAVDRESAMERASAAEDASGRGFVCN